MKCTLFIKCFLLFICIGSCNAGSHDANTVADATDTGFVREQVVTDTTLPTGKLIPRIVCRADAGESYALYIPAKNNETPMPVIYFFDPHADGEGALKRYMTLADRYGFAMAASNNSKNGNDWPAEEHTWSSLYNDTRNRFPIKPGRVYTCGFSGGAKAATYFALQHKEISAVIACGAVLPEMTSTGNLSFSFTAISGEGDMNRSDMVAMNNALDNSPARHCIIFFNGIHEWPPGDIMDLAFAGLYFDAMYKKIMPMDVGFINEYAVASQQRIHIFSKANNQLRAEAECRLSINLFSGISDHTILFENVDSVIKSKPAYQQQLAVSNKLQQREQEIKAIYQQHFSQGDMNYWLPTVKDVMARAKATGAEAAMYQRLKAYLSLAFYSISNQVINRRQYPAAENYVGLYKLVDSGNSEAWYFSAILNAANKNTAQAKADLLKAVGNGFNDKARLQQQEEFKGIELTEIISKMK